MKQLVISLLVALTLVTSTLLWVVNYQHQTILMKYYPVQNIYDNNETGFVAVIGYSNEIKTDIIFAYGDTIPFKVGDKVMISSFIKQRKHGKH